MKKALHCSVIIFALWCHHNLFSQEPLDVFVVYETGHKGDFNQARGVIRSLGRYFQIETILYEREKKAFLEDIPSLCSTSRPSLVITFGEPGISLLRALPRDCSALRLHLSHTRLKNHPALKDYADVVALPTWAVTPDLRRFFSSTEGHTELLETWGVSHAVLAEECEQSYARHHPMIPVRDAYAVLILAGDVVGEEGQIHRFSSEEAVRIANHVAASEPGAHVIVLSSPRTGRYCQHSSRIDDRAHRGSVDAVTQHVMQTLPSMQSTVFDFQFDDPTPYQSIVLGLLLHHPGNIYIPGESVSVLSEVMSVLPPDRVKIYTFRGMSAEDTERLHSLAPSLSVKPRDFIEAQSLNPEVSRGMAGVSALVADRIRAHHARNMMRCDEKH